jgi:hypothetical protein
VCGALVAAGALLQVRSNQFQPCDIGSLNAGFWKPNEFRSMSY